jgi:hypothetical protein
MAFTLYTKMPANVFGGETAGETLSFDFLSVTVKAALFTATYSPNQDTDELYSALANEVANGNGYTTGGNTCGSPAITTTAASNRMEFKVNSPTAWTASGAGFAFRYVVLYETTNSILIGYDDYGSTVTLNPSDTFTYTIDTNGLFTTTVP